MPADQARLGVVVARYAATHGQKNGGWVTGEHFGERGSITSTLYMKAAKAARDIGYCASSDDKKPFSDSDWRKTFAAILYYARRARADKNTFAAGIYDDMIGRAPAGVVEDALKTAREVMAQTPERTSYFNGVVTRRFQQLCESKVY